jgi:hypothetical protein
VTDLLNSSQLARQVSSHTLYPVLDSSVLPKLRALWKRRQLHNEALQHEAIDDLVNRHLLELLQTAENLIQCECGSLGRHPPEGTLRLAHHSSTAGTLIADGAAGEVEIAVDGATALVGKLIVAERPVELVCDFNNRAAWQWQARL